MIRDKEITSVGSFLKPHGISGEINVELEFDIDLAEVRCIVVDVDGIFVPFFVDETRPKSRHTVLVKIDGIENDADARQFTGKTVYVLNEDYEKIAECDDANVDGFFVSDLIGFELLDTDGVSVGEIYDYDDSTENIIIMVRPNGVEQTVYIPLVDDFIEDFIAEDKILKMNLPSGLTEING